MSVECCCWRSGQLSSVALDSLIVYDMLTYLVWLMTVRLSVRCILWYAMSLCTDYLVIVWTEINDFFCEIKHWNTELSCVICPLLTTNDLHIPDAEVLSVLLLFQLEIDKNWNASESSNLFNTNRQICTRTDTELLTTWSPVVRVLCSCNIWHMKKYDGQSICCGLSGIAVYFLSCLLLVRNPYL